MTRRGYFLDWLSAMDASAAARLRLFLICCLVAVTAGVLQGQDANWDLRNYHYYNPYAWLHDRYALDVIPAQIQSWHSPFADLPYYLLVRAGLPSVVVTAVLSLPAGLSLFLLALIAAELMPILAEGWALLALLLFATRGAASYSLIGTTMSEWHLLALILGGSLCLLRSTADVVSAPRWIFFAGLLGGMAVGFKLTAGPYAIGLAVMALLLPSLDSHSGFGARFRLSLTRLVALGAAGVLGFALVFGPWGWAQYQRTGSPLFPYFNNLFKSPLLPAQSFRDDHFAVKSLLGVLALPFKLMRTNVSLVSEMPLREPRLGLAVPAAIFLAWQAPMPMPMPRPRPTDGAHTRSLWPAFCAFLGVSYLLWAWMFGIYRYAGVIELAASLAVFAAVGLLVGRWARRFVVPALMTVALLLVVTTQPPDWGRQPHGRPAVWAKFPPLPSDSMVVLATLAPLGYTVPSLPAEVPAVALLNNVLSTGDNKSVLQRAALARIQAHRGPLFILTMEGLREEKYYDGRPFKTLLQQQGLAVDYESCRPVRTGMFDTSVVLCGLLKL